MRRFLFLFLVAGLVLVPTVASAVSWLPIVPCGASGQQPCSPCDLFKAFHNVIDLVLKGITGPVAAFMIVLSGGLMLVSGGNAKLYGQGKTMLTNTLVGVSIILLSWVFTNFLIKTVAKGNAYDSWYQFSCPAGLSNIVNIETELPKGNPPAVAASSAEITAARTALCAPDNLAARYGVPNNTKLNAPSLTTLTSCIERDPIVKAMIDRKQIFTYERDNPLCNLTRGNSVCGKTCQHSINSCHYGGKTGNQGSMAVDYNWNGKTVTYIIATRTIVPNTSDSRCSPSGRTGGSLCREATGEQGLFAELYRAMKVGKCEYRYLFFERTKTGEHTHISTADCSSDGKDVRGLMEPAFP